MSRFHVSPWSCLTVLSLAAGCGSSDDAGAKCSSTDDCPSWTCVCGSGLSGTGSGCLMGTCASGEEMCDSLCNGDVASVSQTPTLAGSAECNQVCNAMKAAGCDDVDCVHRYCDVSPNLCEAAVRANLACLATNVTWTCDEFGSASPDPSTACFVQSSMCSVDAGAD